MTVFIKILKGLLTFVFSILLFSLIMVWCIMGSTKNLFSKNTINEMFKNINFTEFLDNEYGEKVYAILEETGIPKDYVDEVLNNEEVKSIVSNYASQMVTYIIEPSEIPTIDANELSTALKNSFDDATSMADKYTENIDSAYVDKVKEQITDERKEAIKQKIDEYTPRIIEAIPDAEEFINNKISENSELNDEVKSIEQLRNEFKKIKHIYTFQSLVLILILVTITLIVLLKFKKFKFIKWIMWPFILCGSFLMIFVSLSNNIINRILEEETYLPQTTIKNIFSSILNNFTTYGIICLIVSGLLILTLIFTHIFTHNKNETLEKNPI